MNGDPTKHPSAKRPGYELAYQIGEKLGSVAESMKAAGHSLDHSTEINSQPFSNQFERICKEIVSDEDIREIITKLVQQAKEGNTEAVKILLDR